MAPKEHTPFFSIVICTRDRPELLQIALDSVVEQSCADREIIVVVDGSSEPNLARYRDIEQRQSDTRFHYLEHRKNGHGQSYSVNTGTAIASGRYLCSLDDDDYWTDPRYLDRTQASIKAMAEPVDVHFSHQNAVYADGTEQTEAVWVEDLIAKVHTTQQHDASSYRVNADFLLHSSGFAHMNCSVFRRDFFLAIGCMDEGIRYENDRDIYLRAIDAARVILLSTRHMSLHNIPQLHMKSNMSTVSSRLVKKLCQLAVYDKGISMAKNPAVISFCCRAKTYELKNITGILVEEKRYKSAAFYAREALSDSFNFRWAFYTLHLIFKAWKNPDQS